jgi:hypothetical protein
LHIAHGVFAGNAVQRRGGVAIDEETASEIEGKARGFLNNQVGLGGGENGAGVIEVAGGDAALRGIEGHGLGESHVGIAE